MGDSIPCSVCGQPANVHLTQISSKEVKKVHFCEACAARQEVADGSLAPVAQALALLQAKIKEMENNSGDSGDDSSGAWSGAACPACVATEAKTCPRCGLTGAEFLKSRRLGCATCYKTFETEIDSLLPNIQPRGEHEGKVPGGSALINAIKEALAKTRENMSAAIKAENYEEAALLRDEIRRLETELAAGTSVGGSAGATRGGGGSSRVSDPPRA